MTTALDSQVAPEGPRQLSTELDSSPAWWFLGALVVFRNPSGSPRTPAVIEMTFPPTGFSPLHKHASLDDNFFLLEGEMAVRSGNETLVARPGSYVSLPHGVEYTTRVTSAGPTRLVMIHNRDNFLSLVEKTATRASELRLPREGEESIDMEELMRLCIELETPIMGPPMDEEEARAIVRAHGKAAS